LKLDENEAPFVTNIIEKNCYVQLYLKSGITYKIQTNYNCDGVLFLHDKSTIQNNSGYLSYNDDWDYEKWSYLFFDYSTRPYSYIEYTPTISEEYYLYLRGYEESNNELLKSVLFISPAPEKTL